MTDGKLVLVRVHYDSTNTQYIVTHVEMNIDLGCMQRNFDGILTCNSASCTAMWSILIDSHL